MDEDAAIGQRPLAGQHLDQRRLAVAGDAGNADDLAGLDLEIDRLDRRPALVVLGEEAGELEHGVRVVMLAPPARSRISVSPIIMRLMSAMLALFASPAPVSRPRRSTVKWSQKAFTSRNLCEIISTVIFAALGHAAEQPEHLVGLARRQHRCRLVEDHEALVEIEQLQDLELLLLARRERRDLRVERHAERHALHEGVERLASRPQSMIAGASAREMTRFSAAVRQGTSVKCW